MAAAASSSCALVLLLVAAAATAARADTIKVFVLAGQSNMEGQAEVATLNKTTGKPLNGTLKYLLTDPRTASMVAETWDAKRNNWTILDNVKVWYNECPAPGCNGVNGSVVPGTAGVDATYGNLSVGYGVEGHYNNIGPEYGFGFGISKALKQERFIIIKTAWGGKTLSGDFRPPSSTVAPDPYCQGKCQYDVVGHFYKVMLDDVAKVMAHTAELFPDTAGLTPQIAGFGWFQGWNDGCDLNSTAAYEPNMVNLIKDLRKEWNSPDLPVSIAVSGFDGFYNEEATRQPKGCWRTGNKLNCNCAGDRGCRRLDIILSQFGAANSTRHPELSGHVEAMETRGYWRPAEYSPNKGQGYHFYHNAETYWLIGQAMATGMLEAMKA